MSATTNVFRGRQALRDYYDPEKCPPLPLVELPAGLNPFLEHGVHIYAKMMTALPAANVKSLPALNMLMRAGAHVQLDEAQITPPSPQTDGSSEGHSLEEDKRLAAAHGQKPHTIVEYSSGSTAISLGILSRIFGIERAQTYISNKTSEAKLSLLRFFGLELTLFGGPSQPSPDDERGGIHAARTRGSKPGTLNPDQYINPANYEAHIRWTGPQLMRQLPQLTLFCAGMGTSGTMTGTAVYLKEQRPAPYCLGVCTAYGDRVPGPRTEAMLAPVTFPYRDVVDEIEHVGSHASYLASLQMCRMGLLAGPSSGLALQGLIQHIAARIEKGTLDEIRNSDDDGEVHCAFICCDFPFQYVDEYFDKLGEAHFPAVHNSVLIGSDKYRYDDAWELDNEQGQTLLRNTQTAILDLRSDVGQPLPPSAAAGQRLIIRLLLDSLSGQLTSTCPFADASLLDAQWRELDARLSSSGSAARVVEQLRKANVNVLALCDTGGTSRIATSILRQHGILSFSVKGGIGVL